MEVDFNKKIYAQITAIGGYVPENKRTNSDLEKLRKLRTNGLLSEQESKNVVF